MEGLPRQGTRAGQGHDARQRRKPSSSAASSSTCCRTASTAFATTVCLPALGAPRDILARARELLHLPKPQSNPTDADTIDESPAALASLSLLRRSRGHHQRDLRGAAAHRTPASGAAAVAIRIDVMSTIAQTRPVMLPIIVAGSRRPAAAVLAQKRPFNCDTSVDLYRLRHVREHHQKQATLAPTVLIDRAAQSHRRLPSAATRSSQIAIEPALEPPAYPFPRSSLGGFRTPAPNRG